MNKLTLLLLSSLLGGCASPALQQAGQLDETKLRQMIEKVEQRQQPVMVAQPDPSVLFSSPFDAGTHTLLAAPALMPAILNAPSQQVVILIGVVPGEKQWRDLSHGMRLSLQLQQFLTTQQFSVSRRLDAKAQHNQIQIVLAAAVEP